MYVDNNRGEEMAMDPLEPELWVVVSRQQRVQEQNSSPLQEQK